VFGGKFKTIPVDGHNISTIAFYTGGLTTYGVMLGTFTGILVAIVGAREAGWLKRFAVHRCRRASFSPVRSCICS